MCSALMRRPEGRGGTLGSEQPPPADAVSSPSCPPPPPPPPPPEGPAGTAPSLLPGRAPWASGARRAGHLRGGGLGTCPGAGWSRFQARPSFGMDGEGGKERVAESEILGKRTCGVGHGEEVHNHVFWTLPQFLQGCLLSASGVEARRADHSAQMSHSSSQQRSSPLLRERSEQGFPE